MPISGIFSSATVSQNGTPSQFQQMGKNFTDLGQCLNSGDLTRAQKAFAALAQDTAQKTTAVSGTAASLQFAASNIDITV